MTAPHRLHLADSERTAVVRDRRITACGHDVPWQWVTRELGAVDCRGCRLTVVWARLREAVEV